MLTSIKNKAFSACNILRDILLLKPFVYNNPQSKHRRQVFNENRIQPSIEDCFELCTLLILHII